MESNDSLVLHVRVVTGAGGGPEKTILNSPRFLRQFGYDAVCAYLHPPGDPGFEVLKSRAAELGAELLSIPDRGIRDLSVVSALVKVCRERNIKIWHGHDYKSNALGLLVNRFHPLRLVTTVHGWVHHSKKTDLYYAVDRACLRRYERVVCVSETLLAECLAAGVPVSNCSLIENAIDASAYEANPDRTAAKQALNLPTDRPLIGAVGRLSPEKGFDVLIRAVDQLIEAGTPVTLAIAGEGSLRDELQSLIDQLGRQNEIRLLGHVADSRRLFNALDAFVLSSRAEGLPNVLLEAFACGIPTIATPVGGVPQVLSDEQNGLLVPVDDANALASSLTRLLNNDALQQSLAQAGRQTIETRFSFRFRMHKMVALYDELLGRPVRLFEAAEESHYSNEPSHPDVSPRPGTPGRGVGGLGSIYSMHPPPPAVPPPPGTRGGGGGGAGYDGQMVNGAREEQPLGETEFLSNQGLGTSPLTPSPSPRWPGARGATQVGGGVVTEIDSPLANLEAIEAAAISTLVREQEAARAIARLPVRVELTSSPSAWNDYLASKGHQGFYQRAQWLRVLEHGLQHQPVCLQATEGTQLVGVLPLALVVSPIFGRFLVSLPYVNSSGVVADSPEAEFALVDRAVQLADQLNVRYLELRQEHALNHPQLVQAVTDKVHMRLKLPSSADALWDGIKSKVRNQIRKAQKNEAFSVQWGQREVLGDFYEIFCRNMRDLGTPPFHRELFGGILDQFPQQAEICVVRLNGQPVASGLLVHGPGSTEVPSASALREFNNTNCNMLLYWNLLSRAVERGQTTFDFGRSSRDSGTYAFKAQWGATESPAVWQHYVREGDARDMRPNNGKFDLIIRTWQKLPVWLTKVIGPSIVRGIP